MLVSVLGIAVANALKLCSDLECKDYSLNILFNFPILSYTVNIPLDTAESLCKYNE